MTIIFLCMLVVACKKKAATPATPTAASSSTSGMNSQEQQLTGLWLMDSMTVYSINIRVNTTIYTNTLTCRMEFLSTSTTGGYYNLQDGHSSCSLTQQLWKAPTIGQFEIGSFIHPIITLNSTTLHFIWNGGGGIEYKYYLHK